MIAFPSEGLRVVNIEITDACPLSCLYCSRRRTTSTFMKEDLFHRILESLPHRPDLLIAPYLAGEPLLHPALPEFVRSVTALGMPSRIHTNGVSLTPRLSQQLLEAGLGCIVFSIDGTTREDYTRIRGAAFDTVKDHLRDFLALSIGSPTKVIVQCLVGAHAPLAFNEDLRDLEDQLDEIILGRPHSWLTPGQIPEAAPPTEPGSDLVPCLFLRHYLAINVFGQYLLCCRCLNGEAVFFSTPGGAPRSPDARIPPEEIWDGILEIYRQQQITGDPLPPCSRCDMYRGGRS